MSSKFDRAVDVVLKHEGGYVDHSHDPGGATNFGISLRYARTLGSMMDLDGDGVVDKKDILLVTPEKAKVVYRDWFWRDVRGDELPAGLDLTVFDYAVNSGAGRAIRALQNAAGVQPDGVFGPATMRAVMAADAKTLINHINDGRLEFLKRLPTWPTFGRGWTSRINDVHSRSLELVGAPMTAARDVVHTDTAKATAAMAGAGSVAVAASQAAPAIQALGSLAPWVALAVIAAVAVGVFVWRMKRS
jgi:lysozyme family protein